MKITDYKVIVEGNVSGEVLFTETSLSFWGGVNAATGIVQDIHNCLCGENLTDKVLCIPYDRGSCSSSGVMLEMIRQKTNPIAILCIEAEAVLALGPIIGETMYQRSIAMRTVSEEIYKKIKNKSKIRFEENAIIVEN